MTAIKELEDLLLAVRNESPDDFADFFYATASDIGTNFDDAESYFDFMEPARLTARLTDLVAAGIDETFLVQAMLDHMGRWLADEPRRARRQWRHNRAQLADPALPKQVREMTQETLGRLTAEKEEENWLRLTARFEKERADRFSLLFWQSRERGNNG
ncbi:hypothetical protein ACKQTC_01235 [Peptococcus simiae]|uniref:Uncharacterized protein n=1 Tax=Peptococcus simiae TaxID=1643805 RepID=A0ABW9GWT5_9FIRM